MKELVEKIEDAIEEYKNKKIGDIDVDSDTDFEIYKLIKYRIKTIKNELEELDDEIDTAIEQMNEPSDYELDLAADNAARYRDMF